MFRSLAVTFGTAAVLSATVIVTPVVETTPTAFVYDFRVENTQPYSLIYLQISLPEQPVSYYGPSGWVSNMYADNGNFIVQWASATTEIRPDSSASGFVVTQSTALPASLPFDVIDENLGMFSGTTAAPESVPELPPGMAASIGVVFLIARYKLSPVRGSA
jgi:hypothetical protein